MILNSINSPDDLKKIDLKFLPEICAQVREQIVDTVSKNGGHIASSLGVVELTVALHYIFDSPKDKIVWDVGHQSYAHKILTGRRDSFHTLRQKGGLGGFPKINESPHDIFGTGHASTSISAATGIAKAFKRKGLDNRAIAVIGDGAISGGLAFEALNNAGHKVGNLIVILNDNEMSISKSVGAISKFLSIHIHGKAFGRIKRALRKLLLLIPVWGKIAYKLTQRIEATSVGFFTPGSLFESFGFHYIGPLDGHNLEELTSVFKDVKEEPINDKPILIHVLTKKGKGYYHAETDPTRFHGIGPFEKATGKPLKSGGKTYTKAFSDSILKLGKENNKIVAITAAMAPGTGLEKFAKEFPDRFYDVGIAEGHAVTFAAGLTTEGFRPVVAIYSTFLQRAIDGIIHDVCLQNLPVTFAIDRAGVVGDDGPTHNGTFDLTYLRMIPNLTLLAPRSAETLDKMLAFATQHNGPVAMRYPRGAVPEEVFVSNDKFTSGKAEIVWTAEKPSVAIWAVGHWVAEACKAAELLKKEGINVVVVDPRSVKPLDTELLSEHCEKIKNIVTVEENILTGGFGSAVSEWITGEGFNNVKLKTLGLPARFIEHGSQEDLRAEHLIDSKGITATVRQILHHSDGAVESPSYTLSHRQLT